jgi:hypothetical protein
VVSVLATGSKSFGFNPSLGNGFLRAIKIRSTPSIRWEIKPEVPCCNILWHVKTLDVSKILNTENSHSFIHFSYLLQISLLVGLPESSGRKVRSSTHIHPGDEQKASNGRGSEISVKLLHN